MSSAELEEQQEKLRRIADDWRCRSNDLLKRFQEDHFESSFVIDQCGSKSDPIRVEVEPLDHSDITTLVESDNVAVAKFITVLSYDCFEVSKLCRYVRRNVYRQLFLFGHGTSSQEILLEGEPQKAFGDSLSLFMELSEITCRMSVVMCNLLQQLDSIYSLQDKSTTPQKYLKNAALISAFDYFADGLVIFLVLDEILVQNGRIKNYLSLFTRMLSKVKLEPENFDIAFFDLDCLDQVVRRLEKFLDVGLFRRLFLDELSWVDAIQKARNNRTFLDACKSCIQDGLSEILLRLDTRKESLLDRRKILHGVALFLFYAHASAEVPEKRLGKIVAKMLQVVPVIYSEGGLRLILSDLLLTQFPPPLLTWPVLRDAAKDCNVVKNYLMRLNEMYSGDCQEMKDALASWVVSFQSNIHRMTELSEVEACLQFHFKQIIQGILVANRMQMLTISMLDLHALLEVPIKKERLKSLFHMVILMKVVDETFHKKELAIVQSLPHIINVIQGDIEQSLLVAKDELQSEIAKDNQLSNRRFLSSLTRGGKDADTRLTDSLSLVLMSLQMLQGEGSSKRLLILTITLDVLQCIGYPALNFLRVRKLISKLNIVADFQSIIEEVTDCSFLYWRKEMIPASLSMVYMDISKFTWLHYLLDAFCDGLWLLKLGNVGKFTLHSYEEEIENGIKNEIITPLCRDIETDLRLHVHSIHLKASVHVNPRKTGVHDLSWYLQMKPLRLPFKCIDIKFHIESYLNSSFYNHTAMSSYDWKIYTEMRQLAEMKYGLVLDDIHLPVHGLECGVDVTTIMQDLQKFTTSYLYNITKQVFVEKDSSCEGQKVFRVVSAVHIASSIDKHGLGITSTTVDSMLKFLKKKIEEMSILVQDNFVSYNSVQEHRFWKYDKGEINNNPSTKGKVQNLNRGKISFGDHELNFLEQVRCILTEIGNVLGLERMFRAGCTKHLCSLSRFIYGSSNNKSFTEYSQKLKFTDELVTAGRILDLARKNSCQAEEHIYSPILLLTTLSKDLKSCENLPFKDFFSTIPALILSLLDSKVRHKDRITLRAHEMGNQIITDDGFIMGAAFILKVTDQEKSFDGLNWFPSVHKQLQEELLSLEENGETGQWKGSSSRASLKLWGSATSSAPTKAHKEIDQLNRYLKELEVIHYGLNVARTVLSSD